MNRPILKTAERDDLPPITLQLEGHEHGVLELAVRFMLEQIESRKFKTLEDAQTEGLSQVRKILLGIRSQMNCATIDYNLERGVHINDVHYVKNVGQKRHSETDKDAEKGPQRI